MFGNYFRFVLSCVGVTTFLAEAVLVFLNVADLLSVLPDDVGVGSIEEGARGWQQALALHDFLVYFNVISHILFK
jgi:hypothetical protein